MKKLQCKVLTTSSSYISRFVKNGNKSKQAFQPFLRPLCSAPQETLINWDSRFHNPYVSYTLLGASLVKTEIHKVYIYTEGENLKNNFLSHRMFYTVIRCFQTIFACIWFRDLRTSSKSSLTFFNLLKASLTSLMKMILKATHYLRLKVY